MTKDEALKLQPDDTITHEAYGLSIVREVMLGNHGAVLGVLLVPKAHEHKVRLKDNKGNIVELPILETQIATLRR